MQFTKLMLITFASLALASPAVENQGATNANCGWPNGPCDQNGCNGSNGPDGWPVCKSGDYNGCQCGWGCGRNTGGCNENNCQGVGGRCTAAYRGCSCR